MSAPDFDPNRRRFLKATGLAATSIGLYRYAEAANNPVKVAIVADRSDPIVASEPVTWALDHLAEALQSSGIKVSVVTEVGSAHADFVIFASSSASQNASKTLLAHKTALPQTPEALAIVLGKQPGEAPVLLACGYDIRGLVYAVTEVADLVQNVVDPLSKLMAIETKAEQPANHVRSLTRLFCSEIEDKPWYNDREMWPAYFDMLAAQRFNRFNLAFGIGYDFLRNVTDAYFLFTYPFLLSVPGYSVRVPHLADTERDRNLAMLKYIGEECVKRGLEFHIGLWMHGYAWIDSPNANHTIEGLDRANHGPYCRDAVRMLLHEVPSIHGVTFRIHGESGVEEGQFDFWQTVFDGVKSCGRRVLVDMHAKGMSRQMIEVALSTGQPVQLTPKFWGEHMGLPYHQTDIRKEEKPKASDEAGLMALSSGTRSFLRYSYGDLLTEDRKWTVVHRVWPGTQRVLLWGDPLFAAAYSRAFSFCGTDGVELQEMLSFKGRRGSGHAGDRCAYQDSSYRVRWDWQKYEYGTRVWGRMLYNPNTDPRIPQRLLDRQFGAGGGAIQQALGHVGRILPTVTSVYAPSAGNNTYWPELYLNQSIFDAANFGPYGDSPRPRVFGNASPFDPEMFYSADAYADDLLDEKSNGKYSPVEIAQWLEECSSAGRSALARAETVATGRDSAAYRRAKTDIVIQAGLGDFFAAKFRSGVLFHLYERSKSRTALQACIQQYRLAREHWAEIAHLSATIYVSDITLGENQQLRGHWLDRLPAIDKDIEALSAMLGAAGGDTPANLGRAISSILTGAIRHTITADHQTPEHFVSGLDLKLAISSLTQIAKVTLHYRHVNQAEDFAAAPMMRAGTEFTATIPSTYTNTKFPIQYFFEIATDEKNAMLYPGFTRDFTNQPYFVVRSV